MSPLLRRVAEPIEWEPKDASTFRGFCSKHDDHLFAPLEREPFSGTAEQMALLGYRAVCYELLMKQYLLRVDDFIKEMDKGQPVLVQQFHQEALSYRDSGAEKAIQELTLQKSRYEKMLFSKNYTNLAHYVVFFSKHPRGNVQRHRTSHPRLFG